MNGARWLPWKLLAGPIFLKEVIVSGRRRGVYAMRCAYALLLALVTGFAFFVAYMEGGWGSGAAQRMERLQEIAPMFGEVFGWMQLILLTLVGAVLTAGAFSEERTNRTLHSLMTTPLTSAQIVFGKLSSRLLQIVILAVIPMPVLLALRIYGGLEAERILSGTLLAITSAGLSASIGLLLSIFNRRAWSVIVLSCVTMFSIQIMPLIVSAILESIRGRTGREDIAQLATVLLSPIAAFSPELRGMAASGIGMHPTVLWVGSCITAVVLTTAVCLVASAVLRPVTLREKARVLLEADEPAAAPGAPKVRRRGLRRLKRRIAMSRAGIVIVLTVLGGGFAFVIGTLADQPIGFVVGAAMPVVGFLLDVVLPHRRAEHSREVSDRPVFWRELRSSFVGSRGGVIILGVFVAAILFLAYRESPASLPELHMAILGGFLGVQLLAAATMTTGRISTERDARTWDTLLCTPLSARRIVMEKLMAGFVQLLPIPCAMAAHVLAYTIAGVLPVMVFACVIPLVLAATAMLSSTGLLLGMWRGKATGVAVTNLAFGALLFAGLPIGSLILTEVMWSGGRSELASLTLFFNPVYLSIMVIEGSLNTYRVTDQFELGDFEMGAAAYTMLCLGSAATLTAIGAAAAALSVRLLRKRALRAV